MSSDHIQNIFSDYVRCLEDEHRVKEVLRTHLREVEQSTREVLATLEKMHTKAGADSPSSVAAQARQLFASKVASHLAGLAAATPKGQFYRYQPIFCFALQKLTFCFVLVNYLEHEVLLTKDETQAALGIKPESNEDFHLDLEDYLGGLILLANELTRYAVNSVIHGDNTRPVRISAFLSDLFGGFRMLNLKNDGLRKKFDSLKYDMKKVEEVVYDLAIRGQIKQLEAEGDKSEAKTSAEAVLSETLAAVNVKGK